MLRLVITYTDNTELTLSEVLTVTMDCELSVPADNIILTCAYNKALREKADYISVFNNDELIFKGQIDDIINIKSSNGVITKITARSLASMLLDNEAEPVTYNNPASEFIFNKHLKPFGIHSYEADEKPFYGSLKIDKGMTHWQVFENFCKNRYGVIPRISGDGKAYFCGYKGEKVITFGDDCGDVKYHSIKEINHRCKLISEVKLKLSEFGLYNGAIKNTNPDIKSINRVRYVNATSDRSTIHTADKIIAQSNIDSFDAYLEAQGCYVNLIGSRAEINDSVFGKINGLVVKKARYTLDSTGEKTTFELRKETG